jgi:HEAT repeat protein
MLVRRAAANALGVIGDPRAIPALARCSREDPDRSVRCAAVSSLEAIKDPATLDPLMEALKDPDALVRAMAEAAINRRP